MSYRVAILGSDGLVGDALARTLDQEIVLCLGRSDCDLNVTSKLARFLRSEKINLVINCAAVVGGIEVNRNSPYDLFSNNITLPLSVINACLQADIPQLVQFCSNCSYPAQAEQPYKESDFFLGPPVETNLGYASAKTAAVRAAQCVESQYGLKVYHPIPCSLFGLNDNFSLANSHFIPAVIRKISDASVNNSPSLTFWGSGKPLREFLFADAIASAIMTVINADYSYHPINIGSGSDTPIQDIISCLVDHSGYNGQIYWDTTKPDGALRKLLDSSLLNSLGWQPPSNFLDSLKYTYDFFLKNKASLRL